MALRLNFALILVPLLAFALPGCTGSVLIGAPLDGGDDLGPDPTGFSSDAGTGARDARVATGIDAAQPKSDGGTPVVTNPTPDAGGTVTQPPKDAGSTTAPTPDAGTTTPAGRDFSTDKTKFLGASRCPSSGVLFCDDFESGSGPDSSRWSIPLGYTPTSDTRYAARGATSLHFQVGSGTPGHIEVKNIFPTPNNTIYGRMFVRMGQLPSSTTVAHYTLVGASGTGNDNEVRLDGIYLPPGPNHFGVGSDGSHVDANGQDDDDWHTDDKDAQAVPTAGTWMCLEWLFKGDTNETRVWIDDVEQASLHTTTDAYYNGGQYKSRSFVHPTYTKLRIGWWVYQADALPNPFDLWVDAVALDTQRIGCVL